MSGYQTLLRRKVTKEKGAFPTDKWFEKIATYVNFANKRVLDYGCNTGMLAILAAFDDAFAVGIDDEEENIKTARKVSYEWGNKAKFVCDDIKNIKYPESHDVSILSMIAHWIGKEEVKRIINYTSETLIFIYRPHNDHYQIPDNGTWFPTQKELDKVCKGFKKLHTETLKVQDNNKKIVLAIYERH